MGAVAGVTGAVNFDALIAELQRRRDQPVRVTWADLPFADGVYRFHLGRKEIAELERLRGYLDAEGVMRPVGIGGIFGRLARGRALLGTGEPDWARASEAELLACEIMGDDVIETIRLGLVGGAGGSVDGEALKVSPVRATELVATYVTGRPLEDGWTLAFAVLGLALYGREDVPAPVAIEAARAAELESV